MATYSLKPRSASSLPILLAISFSPGRWPQLTYTLLFTYRYYGSNQRNPANARSIFLMDLRDENVDAQRALEASSAIEK